MLIPFARQSKPGAHSGERLINWFHQPDSNGGGPTFGRSGLVGFADIGEPVYTQVEMGGNLYAISATSVWKLTGATATKVGTISGTSDVRAAASFTQIAIVTNGTYYVCDGTTTTSYSTGSVTAPIDVAFLRGYFAVIGAASGRSDAYTISSLDDGTIFNALDYVFAESAPDGLNGIIAYRNELVLFGAKTVEFHYLSGAADFPFAPNTGAKLERGCLDGATIAADDNSFFWLGDDNIVYRNGGAPQVVSSFEVAEDIKGRVVDRAFTFTDRGHKFYALKMETGTTWVLDITNGLWVEFSTGELHEPWIATSSFLFGGTLYFTTTTGKVCTQGGYNDDGDVIRAEMVSQPVEQGGEYFAINKIHMNFDTGNEDLGRTPQVALALSRDGRTWTSDKWRPLGAIGEYLKRAAWHGLGSARWVQARVWITDEVKRDLIGGTYG